uniref:Uncharacterized protein n=1 Tax=Sus scrofa TaxID=9823 RepID=A0A8D0XXZ2_PIG
MVMYCLKAVSTLDMIPIKSPMAFSTEPEQIILKFIHNHKRPRIATAILRKKNKAGGIILPDFRLCYKATLIKTACYWHKNRQTDQMEQNRDPRNKPTYLSMVNQSVTNEVRICNGKRHSLQQVVSGKLNSHMQISEFRTHPHTIHKNKLKMAERLKYDTITLLEENIGKIISDINRTSVFISQSPKAIEVKTKINK